MGSFGRRNQSCQIATKMVKVLQSPRQWPFCIDLRYQRYSSVCTDVLHCDGKGKDQAALTKLPCVRERLRLIEMIKAAELKASRHQSMIHDELPAHYRTSDSAHTHTKHWTQQFIDHPLLAQCNVICMMAQQIHRYISKVCWISLVQWWPCWWVWRYWHSHIMPWL